MKHLTRFFLILIAVSFVSCNSSETEGPWFGNGVHNGWADQNSIVIWTRLTRNPELNSKGTPFILLNGQQRSRLNKIKNRDTIHSAQIPEGLILEDMEGACVGMNGEVNLIYYPEGLPENRIQTGWSAVDSLKNFTKQWSLDGLLSDTRYELQIHSRNTGRRKVFTTIDGSFCTPPEKESYKNLNFCVVTCHDYNRRDDSLGGHKIYPAMAKFSPDFFVHTGDIEYYDKPNPWAMTEELMRFKWDRLFALPFQREFYSNTTTYFMKDDHDVLRDDSHPGDWYGTVSFERGLDIFDKEQFPSNDLPYKTIRWGSDLQIWLMEGRNFRNNNHLPDIDEKTIWGQKQKEWLFATIEASDAAWKIIISPGPIIGPDRDAKNDNYSNKGYSFEGDVIRAFINSQKNVFMVNGDRHWQYVSHPDGSNLWEFSTGAGSDSHAGGWSQENVKPEHRFLRVKGGFLLGQILKKEGSSILRFTHCDVDGNPVHSEEFIQN